MSEEKIEDLEVKIPGKYAPVLDELTQIWGTGDIGQTLNKSLLLMLWLTGKRQEGYRLYLQNPKGHVQEMAILQQDDITEDVEAIKQQSLKELQKSLKF